MANRPGSLCVMTRNQSIYEQNNFVDTFNWLVASMSNLQGGTGCKVDWSVPDQPTINCDPEYAPNGGGGGGGGAGVESLNNLTGNISLVGGDKSNIEITPSEDGTTIKIDVLYI